MNATTFLAALLVLTAGRTSTAKETAPAASTEGARSARPARSQGDLPFAPTVGLSVGSTRETLRLMNPGGTSTYHTRSLTNTRLDLGLGYVVGGIAGPRWRFRGQSSAGVGLVYALGEWPLYLRQDFGFEFVPRRWFALFAYGSVGVDLNTARPALSAFVLGLPVGLRFGPVELMARPALRVGLGGEEERVAGALQRRSATTGVAPFEVMLRVRIPIRRRR